MGFNMKSWNTNPILFFWMDTYLGEFVLILVGRPPWNSGVKVSTGAHKNEGNFSELTNLL